MFLKRNNIVKVYFMGITRPPKIGVIKSFDNTFFVIQFDDDNFETLIPYHNVESIEAIEPPCPIGDSSWV